MEWEDWRKYKRARIGGGGGFSEARQQPKFVIKLILLYSFFYKSQMSTQSQTSVVSNVWRFRIFSKDWMPFKENSPLNDDTSSPINGKTRCLWHCRDPQCAFIYDTKRPRKKYRKFRIIIYSFIVVLVCTLWNHIWFRIHGRTLCCFGREKRDYIFSSIIMD